MIKTTFKRTLPIVLLSVILLTNSCQKKQEMLSALEGTELQQLKDIYLSNNIPTHRLFSKMEPLWDRAYAMEQEKETVYELPLSNSERIFQGAYAEGKPEEAQRKNNIRLIMTKANADGAYRSFYMSIINDGEATDLTSLHYKSVNDFSGKVLFYTLKGEFINGWHYSAGKIDGSISPSSKSTYDENRLQRLKAGNEHVSSKSGKISSEWWPGDCEQQLVPTYGVSCITVVTSTTCQPYQNGSTYITICNDTGGNGGTGGTGGDGGVGDPPGGSGTTQPTYDCAGVMYGSAVDSMCGCIGGTTGQSQCVMKEIIIDTNARDCLDTLSKGVISSANVFAALRNIFSADVSSNNVAGMISRISQSSDWNVVIKEGDLQTSLNSNGDTVETNALTTVAPGKMYITFNRSYLNQATNLSVARTMIHELMHAYFKFGLLNVTDPGYQKFVEANDLLFRKNGDPYDNQNNAQHEQIANAYVDQVAALLEAYALTAGITSPSSTLSLTQYCKDIAWGGLEGTKAYWKYAQNQTRIAQHLKNEAKNTVNSTRKKGC